MWLLVGACVSFAVLSTSALQHASLALDEHVSYWMLDGVQSSSIWSRTLDYGAVPPASTWVQAAFLAVFGKHEVVLRLPSLLAAWLSLPMVYCAGRRLNGSLTGGIAALLLAWHPDMLDEVRIGRCYGLVVCLASLQLVVMQRWKLRPESLITAVLWGLVSTALLWTHYLTAFFIFCTWCAQSVIECKSPSRRGLWGLVAVTLIVATASVPLWPAVQRLREWSPLLSMLTAETPVWETVSNYWWLALPAGVLCAKGLVRLKPERVAPDESAPPVGDVVWWLLMFSLIPLLVIAIVSVGEWSSLANPRYRVAFVPAGCLLGAVLLTRAGRWKTATVAAVLCCIVSWMPRPLLPWQSGRLMSAADDDWQEINHVLASETRDGDLILAQSGLVESLIVGTQVSDPLFLEYVAARVGRFYLPTDHVRMGLPLLWDDAVRHTYRELVTATDASDIWIACARETDLDRISIAGVESVVGELGYVPVSRRNWPHATLIHVSR